MTIIWNYGGGTDSTGGIILTLERGVIPDAIIWADTGDEAPLENGMARAEYLDIFDEWLVAHGAPKVVRVKWIREDGSFLSIADVCERDGDLPSKAYGNAGCTSKWKQQPCDRWVREHFGSGSDIERWIGYTAGDDRALAMYERRRAADHPQLSLLDVGGAKKTPRDAWLWRAPMWEWGIFRSHALEAIVRAGLPPPGKSACWHCPSSKPHEVVRLGTIAPHLLNRALRIERNADLRTVKGLGRSWSWNDLIQSHRNGGPLFDGYGTPDESCGCIDGGEVDE